MRHSALMCLLMIVYALIASGQSDTTIYRPSVESGISQPIVLKSVPPTYTPQARNARVQGMVLLEAVVKPTGKADDVRIIEAQLWRYLGPAAKNAGPVKFLTNTEIAGLGLDTQATNAVRAWVWKPAMKKGKPVAARVLVSVTFALGLKA